MTAVEEADRAHTAAQERASTAQQQVMDLAARGVDEAHPDSLLARGNITSARGEVEATAVARWAARQDVFRQAEVANAGDLHDRVQEARAALQRLVGTAEHRRQLVRAHVTDPAAPTGLTRAQHLALPGSPVTEVGAADVMLSVVGEVLARIEGRPYGDLLLRLEAIARDTTMPRTAVERAQ